MDLKSKLNTAKGIAESQDGNINYASGNSSNAYSGSVEDLTNLIWGKNLVPDGSGNEPYDANNELKRLKKGFSADMFNNSKLPSAIKESIARNPLIEVSVDPKMDAFTEKIATAMGMKKATDIMNQLDEKDKVLENQKKAALNEIKQNSVSIDYNLIKSIVENAVLSLKDEIKNELNESLTRNSRVDNSPSIKAMKMADKFLFLDSDNNIFECQLVYKGKNKKK